MEIIGDPEGLKREVLEAARREAAAITAAAGAEAERLLAAAAEEAALAAEEISTAAAAEAGRLRAAALASVPAEAARLRAARLEALLTEIKAAALALLAEEPAPGVCAALAAQALAGIGGDTFVITAPPGSGLPGLAAEIERLAGLGPLKLEFEEDPGVGGGAAARSADGRRRWDNTFSARLERLWPEERRRIGAELNGGKRHEP